MGTPDKTDDIGYRQATGSELVRKIRELEHRNDNLIERNRHLDALAADYRRRLDFIAELQHNMEMKPERFPTEGVTEALKDLLGDLYRQPVLRVEEEIVESIECVALRIHTTIYSAPRPKRHDFLINNMAKTIGADVWQSARSNRSYQQGFITSTGRFVSRQEALDIAKNTGQHLHPENGKYQLYSEDIF